MEGAELPTGTGEGGSPRRSPSPPDSTAKTGVGRRRPRNGRGQFASDCWRLTADGFIRPPREADVRHGKFELVDGMLEITYRPSETKVLVFGPASYFVDSDHGGALAEGKLLVYFVQTPDAKPILGQSLFRIRTPTSTVTNGGRSDFELVVNKTPACHVRVFNGTADVQLAGLSLTKRLQAGESLLVQRTPNPRIHHFQQPGHEPANADIGPGSAEVRPLGRGGAKANDDRN